MMHSWLISSCSRLGNERNLREIRRRTSISVTATNFSNKTCISVDLQQKLAQLEDQLNISEEMLRQRTQEIDYYTQAIRAQQHRELHESHSGSLPTDAPTPSMIRLWRTGAGAESLAAGGPGGAERPHRRRPRPGPPCAPFHVTASCAAASEMAAEIPTERPPRGAAGREDR